MIKLVDVHKSYTKEHETIKGVSFEVQEGQIFGLLGPNGAGKTTLMQMIATLMKPTSGQILIDGLSADKELLEIHRKIGFLTNEIKLDPMSTPNILFDFFAKLYDIPEEDLRDRFGFSEDAIKSMKGKSYTGKSAAKGGKLRKKKKGLTY